MSGFQKVTILGALGKDIEMSYTPGGMAVASFSMATSKKKKDGTEVTSWHRLKAFGKTAEVLAQYVGKGSQLFIEGELSYGEYEKDGIKRYTTDILVSSFAFVGGKKSGSQQSSQASSYQQPQKQAFNIVEDQAFGGQFSGGDDSDLPF